MVDVTSNEAAAVRSLAADSGNAQSLHWAAFVDICLAAMLADELGARAPADVVAAMVSLFERLNRARRPGDIVAETLAIEPSESYCDTAVVTAAEDMAFFVDTVSMAVRDTGAEIDWFMNTLVRVRRDDEGRPVAIAGPGEALAGARDELLMRFEFAAPADIDGDSLAGDVHARLTDLSIVVADWQPMRTRLTDVADTLDDPPAGADDVDCAETAAFLRWLAGNRFTFLGYRTREIRENADGEAIMVDVPGSSLGLLREDRPGLDPHGYVASSATLDRYIGSARVLVVAKANKQAWIHHDEAMDVIAVKRLDENGEAIGAHRFLGLFSNEAYAASPRAIPTLRNKIAYVREHAGIRPGSDRAKNLDYILETFPRDELFQSGESELFETVMGVLGMRETEKLRLFVRRDRYDRFFSCLVFVPRERYGRDLRRRIADELARALSGTVEHTDTRFLRGTVVRIYMHIAAGEAIQTDFDTKALERRLLDVASDWSDRFNALCRREQVSLPTYARAFDAAYQARFDAATAVADARILAEREDGSAPILRIVGITDAGDVRLKLYGDGDETPLSTVLPILARFGLSAHTQWPFAVERSIGPAQWIHEFEAEHGHADKLVEDRIAAAIRDAFAAVLSGRAENDGLNRLIIAAGLSPRQVVLVRAITRYLLQTDLPFSPVYVQNQLAAHPALVAMLVRLFESRFDPDVGDRDAAAPDAEALDEQLDDVKTLDADRVLRAFHAVVVQCLRTNYFQVDGDGRPKTYVSLKLDPSGIPELPAPVPAFEAFVYAPEVEGVHLRGGKVARGGIRWSDRREDFRTEVLGLMKAQMVKNAVIVPVGAKGGFVVKTHPEDSSREARQNLGIACYKTFMRGLLDITDNRDGGVIHTPERVVCRDDADPYLVVAADKGTATFSDIANAVAREYDFWLDDAFASGGETGYDHKAMAITARGAWESVKRHFRELGRDTQTEPLTAVGIGDMGGDVLGNGMLQSEQIGLVAAFNHLHIFIDPTPDPASGFAERKRLFEGPNSGWSDYDTSLISAGGGVYQRTAKRIDLSPEARRALNIDADHLTPTALISAILCAPVDLLWNGGIGTYVKARAESHADVGDRANDNVRVNGADLQALVVGEGGNLGFTQAGRIEYALAGGRINTDAIDNSGGVDCSDLEVNIKIALGTVVADGRLDRADRNQLLGDMRGGVAERVLRTNYRQNLQLSLMQTDTVARFDEQISFMRALERDGWFDRRLEQLPDEDTVRERQRNRVGLVRPEHAVLLAYAKIALADAVLASNLPDDPWLETLLDAAFPDVLSERYPESLAHHRLKRELISTRATNQMVNRLGIATAHRLPAGFSTHMADAAEAYLLADAWLGGEALFSEVEAVEGRIHIERQYDLFKIVIRLLKHAMNWWLGVQGAAHDLAEHVERYRPGARRLLQSLPEYLVGDYTERWQADYDAWQAAGLDNAFAATIANANSGGGILDIVSVADTCDRDVDVAAQVYFQVGDELDIAWLQDAIHELDGNGRWQALARASLRNDSYRVHQQIVGQILASDGHEPLADWREAHAQTIEFIRARMDELHRVDEPGHAHLNVVVRDLARLTTFKPQSLARR